MELDAVLLPQRLQRIGALDLAVDENRMSIFKLLDQACQVFETLSLGAKCAVSLTQLGQFQPVFVSTVVGEFAQGN